MKVSLNAFERSTLYTEKNMLSYGDYSFKSQSLRNSLE